MFYIVVTVTRLGHILSYIYMCFELFHECSGFFYAKIEVDTAKLIHRDGSPP